VAFHSHERFQAHFWKCFKVFEADTIAAAIAEVEQHEKQCFDKPQPVPQKTIPTEGLNK
jgi:ribulose bisphosphate carboxylase small subunit